VVVWGSTALSDMLLTSTIGATLLTFFWGYATHVKWGYPMSAVFMGLACLSKGPIGIVFPVSCPLGIMTERKSVPSHRYWTLLNGL
jgi:4-amino-4-deoxy-L-arabinose transferase-like glycosyltransferase